MIGNFTLHLVHSLLFFIILKNLNYNSEKVAITDKNSSLKIAEKQKNAILSFANERENFKTKEIEELLNIQSARARRLLTTMVTENLLEALGQNRNRHYKLKD